MLLAGPRLNWGHQPAPERDTSLTQGQAAWPDPLHGRGFWCTGGGSGASPGCRWAQGPFPRSCGYVTLCGHRCAHLLSQYYRQPAGLYVNQSTCPSVLDTEKLKHGAPQELCHSVSPVGARSAGHMHPEHCDRHSPPGNSFYQGLPG